MTVQTQPNVFTCLPTAFAMVLDIPVFEIISELGHDGSQIVDPDSPEPFNVQGWHPQELKLLCWKNGYSVTEFFSKTGIINPVTNKKRDCGKFDLRKVLWGNQGVCCTTKHAFAWDGLNLIDPDGGKKVELREQLDKLVKVYLIAKRRQRDDLK